MVSNDKDDNDLELENTAGGSVPEDAIDLEMESGDVPPLSAGRGGAGMGMDDDGYDHDDDYGGDLDVDITGDEAIDFADEAGDSKGGGKMKKMMAPALVLVAAAGIGGYIVMNPALIAGLTGGGGASAPVQAESSFPAAQDVALQATADITEGAPAETAEADMFSTSLPQPTANQNEIPRSPDQAPAEDLVADLAQESFAPAEISDAGMAPVEISEAIPVDVPAVVAESPTVVAASPVDVTETTADVAAAEIETISMEDAFEQGSADSAAGQADGLTAEIVELKGDIAAPQDAPANFGESLMPMEDFADVSAAPESQAPAAGRVETSMAESLIDAPVAPLQPAPVQIAQAEIAPAVDVQPPQEPLPRQMANEPPAAGGLLPKPQPSSAESRPLGDGQETFIPSDTVRPAADVYYDGVVPTGPLANSVGPRKADPQMEPASQLVVVKKAHEGTDLEAMVVSANRALKLKRYDSALEIFDQLYARNPRDPRILMGRAVAQQNTGLTESAIRSYEELIAINPKNADAVVNMLGLLRQQYPAVALRRLKDLQDKHPDNAGIAAQMGITHADLGEFPEALRSLGRAVSLEPQNAQHMFNLAVVADRSGDAKAAVKYYEQALELDAVHGGGRTIPRENIYDRLSTLRRR